jgi:hypothetical protein
MRGYRVAAAGTLAAAALLIGGCGAGEPGTAASQAQQANQLAWALREWSGFPASASPRPLVLAAVAGSPSRIVDPMTGFRDSADKLAYLDRAIDVPAALPAGPAAAAGYPLISARQGLRVLMSGPAQGGPATVRLKITGVRLGTRAFDTDRGAQSLPAWLVSFVGVQSPAAVLAVSPIRLYTPPGNPPRTPPVVYRAIMLGAGGRTLTVDFTGLAAGTGPCTAGYSLRFAQSRTAVAVAVIEHDHPDSDSCSSVGYGRHATAVLPAPLAARVLVDAASGTAIPEDTAAR